MGMLYMVTNSTALAIRITGTCEQIGIFVEIIGKDFRDIFQMFFSN
jgi:hypothetical protein